MIKWEKYRDQDGYIDLPGAYMELKCSSGTTTGLSYLYDLQDLQGIKSRQAAALAIMAAKVLDGDLE